MVDFIFTRDLATHNQMQLIFKKIVYTTMGTN